MFLTPARLRPTHPSKFGGTTVLLLVNTTLPGNSTLSRTITQRQFAAIDPSLVPVRSHWASLHTIRGPAFEPRL
jgi:hypothetical protein